MSLCRRLLVVVYDSMLEFRFAGSMEASLKSVAFLNFAGFTIFFAIVSKRSDRLAARDARFNNADTPNAAPGG